MLIDAKYGSNECSLSPSSPTKYFVSPLWKKISGLVHVQSSSGVVARNGLMHCVRRGNKTRFWENYWVKGHILKLSFPRMFVLAIHKSGPEVNQFEAFSSLLNLMMFVASNDDKVIWSFEYSDKFSSKSFCYEVENMNYHGNPLLSSIWKFKAPPKARLLCWQVERPSQWCPPDDGALKFNVDGSAKGKPGFAAIGGLLRNSEGVVVALFSIPVGVMDSNVAEVLAIKEACKMLNKKVEFNSVKIVIESDSLNAVSWECNSDADKLAKDGVYRTSPLSIWKDGRVTLR
ncbi:reverse transcriptase [Tanacetum coccineum]